MPKSVRNVLILVAILSASACSRNVRVESEPTRGYAVQVRNTMPHSMVVSYNDRSGPRILGTVLGGATERFVIAAPRKTDITVLASDEAQTHNRVYNVTLIAGNNVDVAIR
jgi:hypothetical protein